jgi:hypothetical protein
MSLQTIINYAESITINRRKVAGIQFTRNQIARVSSLVTRNPWRFTVKMPALLKYSESRELIETLDKIDRITPQQITFSDVPGQSFMFAYQGAMNATQRAAVTITSFVGKTLTVEVSPTLGTGAVIFKAGDVIQIAGYPYPFSVESQVVKASGTTAAVVTVHRGNFFDTTEDPVVGLTLVYGNAVTFNMLCTNMPTYTIIPGPYVQFDSDFELYEFTGTIL